MAKRIIVLSDGTWESVGEAVIITVADDTYDNLCDGVERISDLVNGDGTNVISTENIN